jgi:hypothetical protein
MKSSRPLFYQCRVALIVAGLVLLSCFAHAADDDDSNMVEEVANPTGKIEIQYEAEAMAPYRQRRGTWSPIFGINASMIQPKKYFSEIDGDPYDAMFGSQAIPMVQAQFGAQYNFTLGSLGFLVEGGYGQVSGSNSGTSRSLSLMKKGASLTYTMNTLWPEPYLAPYISGELLNFDYREEGATDSKSGSTAFTSALTVGLLIQLNWLDPDSALDARNSSGLNNIFLDVFASQYNTSNSSTDANFQSDLNWGAGLKFEF